MIRQPHISTFICVLLSSILLPLGAQAQNRKPKVEEKDTTALFRGVAISADLFGAGRRVFSDYGQYEVAARLNLKDRWFPIVEVGIGQADAEDDTKHTHFKTSSPYFRVGMDFNILRNKHDRYRLYAGARYAYTNYSYDVWNNSVVDPVYGGPAEFRADNQKGYYHWAEGVFGVDVTICQPLHLGWSVRYQKRLAYKDGEVGNTWYVPGFGRQGGGHLNGTFNVIIELNL